MNIRKILIISMIMVMVVIGASGCMKKKYDIDGMMEYISNKYPDDSFEFVNISGGNIGSLHTTIRVRSEKYPDWPVYVYSNIVDGERKFWDGYLCVKFEKDMYEYIRNALVERYGDNVYVKYVPYSTVEGDVGSSDTTFEEFAAMPHTDNYFRAAVIATVEDEEAEFNEIAKLFDDIVICGFIYFFDTEFDVAKNGEVLIEEKKYVKELYFVKRTTEEYWKIEWEGNK